MTAMVSAFLIIAVVPGPNLNLMASMAVLRHWKPLAAVNASRFSRHSAAALALERKDRPNQNEPSSS